MRLLVIAPHPDDESIGCGGTILLHRQRGDPVSVVFLTSGERGIVGAAPEVAMRVRESEAAAAAEVLGIEQLEFLRFADSACNKCVAQIAERLRSVIDRVQPQALLLPHPEDQHPDHLACLPIVQAALRGVPDPPELRGYEIWTPLHSFQYVEDISAVMPHKLRAIAAHRSQVAQLRYELAAAGLNSYRGVFAGACEYAEVMSWLPPGRAKTSARVELSGR
jgi:N-acetylglucosamine malate deacetylase 1